MTTARKRSVDISAQIAEQIRDMIARGALSPQVHLIPARIATQIQEMAAEGKLAPGVNFAEIGGAGKIAVSRMPVREALKLLVGEGVVLRDQNRGFFVAPLSSDEARQLYRLRHLIEHEVLSSVEWPTAAQLRKLQALLDDVQKDLSRGDLSQWLYGIRDFHRSIFDLSPKKILRREALRIWTLCDRYRSLLTSTLVPTSTVGDHMIDALAKRDRETLLRSFEDDLSIIERSLLEVLQARSL